MIKPHATPGGTSRKLSAVLAPAMILLVLISVQACNHRPDATGPNLETLYAEPRPPTRSSAAAKLQEAFDRNAAYARDLHVSPEGDDEAGTGTLEAPFATVIRALRGASPGTRVILAPGRHAPIGSLADIHGEPGAPIAIVGAKGSIIDGRLTDDVTPGLHLSNPKFVVVDALTVEYAFPHGISIDDGGGYATPAGPVVLRDLELRDIGRGKNNDCLKMSGVDNFQVMDSEFHNCDQGEAIDMVGCHRGLISGNTFRKTPGAAVKTKGGSSDIAIHGNRFIEVTARSVNLGGETGAAYFRPLNAPYEAARIHVLSNIFYRSGGTAIAFTGCIECLVAHNTVLDPQGYVLRLLEEHPDRATGRGGRFINNLVVFKADEIEGLVTAAADSHPATFAMGGNLWFARDREQSFGPVQHPGFPPEKRSLWGLDPKFVAPSMGDYRLQKSSPALGAGLDIPGTSWIDFDGLSHESPVAVGAHAESHRDDSL